MFLGMKGASSEVQSGIYSEVDYLFHPHPVVGLGPGLGFSFFDNKVNSLSKGDIMMIPILFKTRLATPGRTFSAFFETGLGCANSKNGR